MASESTIACPCCGRESGPPHRNTTFPFCSRGCKLADLGRWLDGAYALDPVSGRLEVVDPDEAEELDPDALH